MKSKVRAKWVVKIPEGSRVLVKEGDKVEKGDKLLVLDLQETKYVDLSSVFTRISKDKLNEMNEKWLGVVIKEGDLLCETGGVFSRKIMSPYEGVVGGIDEFFNMRVDIKLGGSKDVHSPVAAKVSKVEKEKLVLAFEAVEYEGRGIVEGRVWGDGIVKVENLSELNVFLKNKFVVIPQVTQSLITKADVMGVAGLIVIDEGDKSSIEAGRVDEPVLALSREKVESVMDNYIGKDVQILMNSKVGRLLFVEGKK